MSDLDSKLAALREATQNLSPDEGASERLKQALAAEAGNGPDVSALLRRRWWPWFWLGLVVVVVLIIVRWGMPTRSPEQQPSGSSPTCACRLPIPPDRPTMALNPLDTEEQRSEKEARLRTEHHSAVLAWVEGLSRLVTACPSAARDRMLSELGQRGCQIGQRQRADWVRNGHPDAAAGEAATTTLERFRSDYRLLLEASAPGLRFECDLTRDPGSESFELESCPAFAEWDPGLPRQYFYSVDEKRLAESHEANVALLSTYRDAALRTRVVRDHLRWLCAMVAMEQQASRVDAFAAEARFFSAELQRLEPLADSSCGAVLDGGAY